MDQHALYANRPEHLKDDRAWKEYLEECKQQNERAKQQRAADEAAEHKALGAEQEAKRSAAAQQAIASYKLQARASFVGTQTQFNAAWPDILQSWQVGQITDIHGDLVARKRASGRY